MARGWESKSVEEQMAGMELRPGNGLGSDEARRLGEQQRAERERRLQSLNLQRENILSQRTSNPGRRAALEAALKQIEASIDSMN